MQKEYTTQEVCKILGISTHTLKKWYVVESARMKDEPNTEYRLPEHRYKEHMRGKPIYYLESDIEHLKEFREKYLKIGRGLGAYGKYTNPNYNCKGDKNGTETT